MGVSKQTRLTNTNLACVALSPARVSETTHAYCVVAWKHERHFDVVVFSAGDASNEAIKNFLRLIGLKRYRWYVEIGWVCKCGGRSAGPGGRVVRGASQHRPVAVSCAAGTGTHVLCSYAADNCVEGGAIRHARDWRRGHGRRCCVRVVCLLTAQVWRWTRRGEVCGLCGKSGDGRLESGVGGER